MSSPQFHIITDWSLDAPREAVWPALIEAEQWPSWWRAVKRVERISDGDESGIGAVRRMTWSALPWSALPWSALPWSAVPFSAKSFGAKCFGAKSWRTVPGRAKSFGMALPFSLTFDLRTTRIEPLARIEGEAEGALRGRGRWDIWPDGRRSRVRYEWIVALMEPRLRFLAPLLRQVFVFNHNAIMGSGFTGLVAKLAAQRSNTQPLRKI